MATQAQQTPHVHPRRRALKAGLPSLLTSMTPDNKDPESVSPTCRLQKGATFHSATSPPREDKDPVLNIPSLPRRSPTCTKTLEAIVTSQHHLADILGSFTLSSPSLSNTIHQLGEDSPPVPRGILEAQIRNENVQAPRHESMPNQHFPSSPTAVPGKDWASRHRHASDSGLGSSVSTLGAHEQVKAGPMSTGGRESSRRAQSAITRSISSVDTNQPRRQLSRAACKQIERFILLPILREEKLKPFHKLIQSVPTRIVNKEITCLRDLEKTLLWLGPTVAHSKASYFGFAEFTIQSIHTAVSHLNERDQRLPSDRPYTNGYFLDLVGQIRQYAATIAASRERTRALGEETEPASTERVTLEGGLSETGRPAELVCHKDGKAISLRTGEPYDEQAIPTMKRALSNQSMDEGVERSMARRKKNAPPMDINQKCSSCDKVFKRPCDLTKHEKTHSRPWKCVDTSCKYYEVGWPTEKERDRHVNDRHSRAPSLYKCQYSPCTYQSKRESNCKQHMEKAHGWVYVRSKNNGKHSKRPSSVSSVQPTPHTPAMSTPVSNISDLPTPLSGPAPSPYDPYMGLSGDEPFNFADPPANPNGDFQLFPDNTLDDIGLDDMDFPTSLNFNAFQTSLEAGNPNELMPSIDLHRPSMASTGSLDSMGAPSIFDASPLTASENSINFDLDWSKLDSNADQNNDQEDDFTVMHMQMLTPTRSVEAPAMTNTFSHSSSATSLSAYGQPQNKMSTSLSPVEQGNVMLYSPQANTVDDGFNEMYQYGYSEKPGMDFTLFDSSYQGGMMSSSRNINISVMGNANQMFPPLNNFNGQFANSAWHGHTMSDSSNGMDMDGYLP